MTDSVRPGEAAKILGVHRLTIEGRAEAAGWVVSVARGQLRTTGGGVAGGFVVPITEQVAAGFGRGVMNREVGYLITKAGIAALRQIVAR